MQSGYHKDFPFFDWGLTHFYSTLSTMQAICDKSAYPVKRRALHLAQFNFTFVKICRIFFTPVQYDEYRANLYA